MRHVGNERGDFDEVIECGAAGGQSGLQVFENLRCLGGEVAFADDLTGLVEGDLTRNIDCPSAVNLNDMRVAGRSRQRRRIQILNSGCWHGGTPLSDDYRVNSKL